MICGVQGDFTRSLVNDPPRTLWTRELKVCDTIGICKIRIFLINVDEYSSPVSRTRRLYTNAASVFAQELVSALRCRHVFSRRTGKLRCVGVSI